MMTSYCQATMTTVFVPRDGYVNESLPRHTAAHLRSANNVFQTDDVYVLLVPSNYIHSKPPGHIASKYDLGKVVAQPSPAFAFPAVEGVHMMAAAPVPEQVEVADEEVVELIHE